ncbi:MAG: LPS export ABC transporter periplasmic protein LptC [Alistipes sp.]|nr:LPS export ABC transporter periplasmic protein LptC [Alistipes sp.]
MRIALCRYAVLALLLVGSASLLSSCDTKPAATLYDYETLMTESSENRTITMMENGKRSYSFTSPLMEGYSMASNPYQEFRRGIRMTTYTDSLSLIDATITANYAIYYERQRLWEAKGNVVIIKNNREEGDTTVKDLTEIYTQQLFWNATTKKIYSNVDTKVLQADGWHFGVGFDADDDLKNIHFRKYSSEMEFDMSQPEPKDKTTKESDKAESKKEEKSDNSDTKRQTVPQKDISHTVGGGERNTPPLPVGGASRPTATQPTKREQGSVTPVAPSLGGGVQKGKKGAMGAESLSPSAIQAGNAALKPTAGAARRDREIKNSAEAE